MSRHARAPSFVTPAFVALVLVVGGPARPSEPPANEEVTCPIETRHDPDDGTTRLYVSGTLVAEGMELGGGRDPYEARVAYWRLGGGRVLVASPAPRLIEVSCAEPKVRKLFYGEADADFLTAVEVDGGRGLVFGARRGLRVLDLATATARTLVPAVKLSTIVSGCESSAGDVALFRPVSTSPDGRHITYDLGGWCGWHGLWVGTRWVLDDALSASPPAPVRAPGVTSVALGSDGRLWVSAARGVYLATVEAALGGDQVGAWKRVRSLAALGFGAARIHVEEAPPGARPSDESGAARSARVLAYDFEDSSAPAHVCNGSVALSDDGGTTWRLLKLAGPVRRALDEVCEMSYGQGIDQLRVGAARNELLLFAGDTTWRTSDGGLTWQRDARPGDDDTSWRRPGALGVHVGTHNREGSLADATPPVRLEVHPDGLWERRAGGPSRRVFGARELEAAEPGRALLRRAGLASPAAWNEDPVVRGEADEHNLAGLAHHRKERWDEAIGAYLEATRRDPSHVWARYNLACAWARSAEPELSLAALSELVDELCLGGVLHDEERCRTLVRKAGKDADFAALAADPRLTGILGTAVRAPFRAPR